MQAVFGKFYGKAMVGRLVEPCNKAFDKLPREQLEAGALLYIGLCYFHFESKRVFNAIFVFLVYLSGSIKNIKYAVICNPFPKYYLRLNQT